MVSVTFSLINSEKISYRQVTISERTVFSGICSPSCDSNCARGSALSSWGWQGAPGGGGMNRLRGSAAPPCQKEQGGNEPTPWFCCPSLPERADGERDRERQRERERERERERQRETERDRERQRETERDRERQRETERQRERERQRETERERERERETVCTRGRKVQQRYLSYRVMLVALGHHWPSTGVKKASP